MQRRPQDITLNDDSIIYLTSDAWFSILVLLSPRDLLALSEVCIGLHYHSTSDTLWRELLILNERDHRNTAGIPLIFKFFNIDHMMMVFREQIQPLVDCILHTKEVLSAADRRFIKMVGNHNPNQPVKAHSRNRNFFLLARAHHPTRSDAGILFDFLAENPSVLCADFVRVPVVLNHLYRAVNGNKLTQCMNTTFSQPNIQQAATTQQANQYAQILSLCCLLSEHDEELYSPVLCAYYISEHLGFAQLAHQHGIVANPVVCTHDLFALARLFIQQNSHLIDMTVAATFYDCYTQFLAKTNAENPLIAELQLEKDSMAASRKLSTLTL